MDNHGNTLVALMLGMLTGYALYLERNELAGTGIGALAGVLMQQFRQRSGDAIPSADNSKPINP